MADRAVTAPRAVSTATPAPPQDTRVTGVDSLISSPSPSRRATNAPMPPSGTRLLPDSTLRSQSRALNSSALATQMIGPSHVSTVTAHGSSGIDRATSASGTSSRVSQHLRGPILEALPRRRIVGVFLRASPRACPRRCAPPAARPTAAASPPPRARSAPAGWSRRCAATPRPCRTTTPPSSAGCVVHARPPMRPDASSTTALRPAARNAVAAPSPASPAPITTTSTSGIHGEPIVRPVQGGQPCPITPQSAPTLSSSTWRGGSPPNASPPAPPRARRPAPSSRRSSANSANSAYSAPPRRRSGMARRSTRSPTRCCWRRSPPATAPSPPW